MALQLDLNKSAQSLKLSLEKAGIISPPQVDLAFDLDVSGSFDDEHRAGLTNDLLTRLVPWGMVFDPDRKLDVFTFSNSERNAHYVGSVNPDNCNKFVQSSIIDKVPGYNGGTDYSYVLERNLEHFGWKQGAEAPKKSFLGGLFGSKKPAPSAAPVQKKRSIVIFVTDGDCDPQAGIGQGDKGRTERVLNDSFERKDEVYFLFLGVSNQSARFPFIDHLGDKFGNVGFVPVNNVRKWTQQTDEQINQALLGQELLDWLKA